MQTFIISTKNFDKGKDEIFRLVKENLVNEFDFTILEFEKSLGIEDVRNIQKNIHLKPFQGINKAVSIVLNNSATLEAQNSLLKLFEEPPNNTFIFILIENSDLLIPTVLSRAKIIAINDERKTVSTDKVKLLSQDPLFLAQNISLEKQESIKWLEDLILELRSSMLNQLENKIEALRVRNMIHKVELTHYTLKTSNANYRLALENLFLSLN